MGLVLALGLLAGTPDIVRGQQTVYWRNGAGVANWWDGANPWYRSCDGWWIARPDYNTCNNNTTVGANEIHFDNGSDLTMNINGTYFQVTRLLFDNGTGARTMTAASGGGIDMRSSSGTVKIENNDADTQTINAPVVFYTGVEINPVQGNLTFNQPIYFKNNWLNVWGNNAKTLNLNGVLDADSGNGGLAIKQNSLVVVTNNNTITGAMWAEKGVLRIGGHTNAVGASGVVYIGTNAALDITYTGTTRIRPAGLTLYGGYVTAAVASATTYWMGGVTNYNSSTIVASSGNLYLNNGINLASGTLVFNNANEGGMSGGSLTGTGTLDKQGSGAFRLRPGTHSGNMTLSGGEIRQYTGTMNSGGTLTMANGTTYRSDGGTARTMTKASALNGNVTLGHSGGGAITFSGNMNLNNAVRTITVPESATISGVISSSGGIDLTDVGILNLTAENTYSGATTVRGGARLAINRASGDPLDSSGITLADGSSAGYLHLLSSSGYTLDTPISVAGGNFDARIRNFSGANTLSGGITVDSTAGSWANKKIEATGGSLTIATGGINLNGSGRSLQFSNTVPITVSSVISGSSGNYITKDGSGTLTLSGNNTFSRGSFGTLYAYAGTVDLRHGNAAGADDIFLGLASGGSDPVTLALGASITVANDLVLRTGSGTKTLEATLSSGTATLSGGVTLEDDVVLAANSGGDLLLSGVISGAFSVEKTGADDVILTGANTYSAGTTISGGTLQIGNNGTSGAVSGNIVNNAAIAFYRSNDITYSGAISGSGTLNKLGAGVLTLSGTSSMSGNSTVSAGTLLVSGSLGSSAVTVNSGATLAGAGTVGAVTLNGTVSPGDTSGAEDTLSCGAINLGSGGGYTFDIANVSGTAGTEWDLLDGSGTLTVNASGIFTIYLTGDPTGFNQYASYAWTFMSGSSVSGFNAARFSVDTGSFTPSFGGSFSVDQNGNNLRVVYTPAVPATPTGLSASDGSSTAHVALSWDDISGEDGYRVWRHTANTFGSASPIASTASGSTTYNDTTATAGTLYYYWITATNGSGSSAESTSDSGYKALSAPANVAATDGSSTAHVTVTWDAVTGATSYKVFRNTSDTTSGATDLGTQSSPFNDTGATAGTLYYYFVKAVDDSPAHESAYSSSDSGYRALSAPANVAATDGSSTAHVTVTWDAVTGADSYKVFRNTSDSTSGATDLGTQSSPFNDTGATAGTLYYYFVKAVDSSPAHESAYSSSDSGYKAVSAPANVAATDGSSTAHVQVTWDAATGATSYNVYRDTDSNPAGATDLGAQTSPFDDTGATPGQLYYYWVKSVDSSPSHESDYSSSDTGYRKLATVAGLSATIDTFSDKVRVTWTDSTGETGYGIWRHTSDASGSATYLASVGAGTVLYDDTTATATVDYYYWVRATNTTSESQSDFQGSGAQGRRAAAVIGQWDGEGGNGNWGTAANWSSDTLPGGGDDASFYTGIGSGTNINLDTTYSINSVTFLTDATTALRLDGSALTVGADGITVESGAAAHTIANNVVLGANQTWENASSSDFLVSGDVSGAYKITKSGTGRLVLSGNNTFSGDLDLDAGYVQLDADADAGGAGDINIASGATLELIDNQTWAQDINLAGLGVGSGPSIDSLRASTLTGTLTLTGDASIRRTDDFAGNLTLDGPIVLGANTLTLTVENREIRMGTSSSISGSKTTGNGAIFKTGAGIFQFRPDASLSGSIILDEGIIEQTLTTMAAGGEFVMRDGTTFRSSTTAARDIAKRTVLEGNVTIGDTGDGDITFDGNVDLDGGDRIVTALVDVVMSGIVSNGGLTKAGTTTLTLEGYNTFAGVLKVPEGAVSVAIMTDAATAQPLGKGTATNAVSLGSAGNDATLIYTGSGTTSTKPFTLEPDGTGVVEVTGAAVELNLAGVIGGGGALRKSGSGVLMLTGNNTYEGQTVIDDGILSIVTGLSMGVAPASADPDHIVLNGGTLRSTTTFTLAANRGITISAASALQVTNGTTLTYGGIIAGSANLTLDGTGTLILGGVNTYSGATAVDAGTVIVNGSADNSAFTVASGAEIQGSGSVGNLTVSGTVDPGNQGIGALTVDNLTLNNGSTVTIEIGDWSDTSSRDRIVVGGTFSATATVTLDLDSSGISNFDATETKSWVIIDDDAIASTNAFVIDETNFTEDTDGGIFLLDAVSGDLVLRFIPRTTGVSATDGAHLDKVVVSWDDVTGETGYKVYRNTVDNSGTATQIGGTQAADTTSYDDTTAAPGQLYYYWVRTVTDLGDTDFSDNDTGYVKLPTVAGVNATDNLDTQVTVTWTDSDDGETGYTVWRHTSNDPNSAVNLTATALGPDVASYNDTSGTAGTTYYYWVRATNNTSASSSDFGTSDTGIKLEAEPDAASAIVFSSIGSTSMTVGWTLPGTPPDGVIVVAKAGSGITDPVDANSYSASATFGSGTDLGGGSYVVYDGSGTSVSVSGLSPATVYYFAVYAYNGSGSAKNYRTSDEPVNSQTTRATEPTTQASGLYVTGTNEVSLTGINWSNGNGAGRIVVVKAGSAVDSFPVDGTTYSASSTFGSGSQIGTGNYVVHSGSAPLSLSGLDRDVVYHIRVFEYNGSTSNINYLTSTASANPISQTTMASSPGANPSAADITSIGDTTFTVSWTGGDGTNTIVLVKAGGITTNPSDLNTYTADADFSGSGSTIDGAKVVYIGNGSSVDVTGLSPGTTYFVKVYEFNGGSGSQNYRTSDPASDSDTTLTSEPTQATAITFPARTKSSIQVSWTTGGGANRVVVAREASAVNSDPVDTTDYSANSVFGSGDELGTGNFVVYNGSGSSVTVTGLKTNTTYHFRVYEFNGSGVTANYNTNSASGNPASHATADNEPGIGIGANLTVSSTLGNAPSAVTFGVTNIGGGTLAYAVTTNNNWLSVSPFAVSGKTTGQDQTHTVTFAMKPGMEAGVSNATITLTNTGTGENAATNSPRTLNVEWTLNAIPDPTVGTATADGNEFVRLAWTKNTYDVLVVYQAGTPPAAPAQGTAYAAGDSVAGGGTVLYKGSDASATLEHEVASGTTHYYAFYSENYSYYSAGLTDSVTLPSYGANEIFDPFAYTNNVTFDAKDGGTGWDSAWDLSTGGGATWRIITPDDDANDRPIFLDAASNQVAMSGNRAFLSAVGGSRWGVAERDLATLSTGSVYFATMMAYRYEGAAEGDNRWATIALMNGTTEELEFGKAYDAKRTLTIRRSGSNASSSFSMLPYTESSNNWYWVVLKYDFENDEARLWGYARNQNIPASEPSGEDADWTSLSISQITGIRLKAGSAEDWIGGAIFDEVRVARTWNELIGVTATDPALYVGPTNISLSVMKGSSASATFTVTNLGTEVLYYTNAWDVTYGSGSAGVGIAPTSATVNGNSTRINTGTVFGITVGTSYATNRISGNQTNDDAVVSFAVTVTEIPAPTSFTATDDGAELVRLSWSSAYNVMVVYNEGSDLSGTPTDNTTYNVGSSVVGGTVIYKGSANALEHVVNDGATHYYRVYAINNNYYSDAASASATTAAYDVEIVEPFAYTNGVGMAGLNGGEGWSGAWTVGAGTWSVHSGSLVVAASYPVESANKARLENPGNNSLGYMTRPITPVSSGKLYVSGILRFQYPNNDKFAGIELISNGTAKAFFGEVRNQEKRPGVAASATANAWDYDGTYDMADYTADTGNVYLVVGRYDFTTRDFDMLAYYRTVAVPEVEPTTWNASYTLPAGTMNQVDGIRLVAGSQDEFNTIGRVYFDEIRVASTWPDLLKLVGVTATNYIVGNATNHVYDGQVKDGTFPVSVDLRAEAGVESVSTTPPFFVPNFDLFNTNGTQIVTDQVFSVFSYLDGGKTLVASNTSHSTVQQADVVLGVYTARWSAVSSNGVPSVNQNALSNGTVMTFTVVDDDETPPEAVTINSPHSGAFRYMHLSSNTTAISAVGGTSDTNITYEVTDHYLAHSISGGSPFALYFGARDAGSGVNRGNGAASADSSLTIGSAIVSNTIQWDATRSSSFTNTYAAKATNAWSWITGFSASEIESLVTNAASGVVGSNRVTLTWHDADLDRADDDQSTLYDQQHGWLVVRDDDTAPPTIQNFRIFGQTNGPVSIDELIGGIHWQITGTVFDAYSGVNVNGTETNQPNISPYFELWDPNGTRQLLQAFNTIPFANGGAQSAGAGSVSSDNNNPVGSAITGIWTARVIAADADLDWAGDRAITTNEFSFEVITGTSLAGIDVSTTLLVQTSSYGVINGPTNFIVENVGISGSLIVTPSPSAGWLSVSPSGSITVPNGADTNLNVTLDAGTLNPGTYEAVITLSGNQTNGARYITNRLTVVGFFANEIVDPFTNNVGTTLNGSTQGTGWDGFWAVSGGNYTSFTGSLSIPVNYPAAAGNQMCADSAGTELIALRDFPAVTTGKIYAAMAFTRGVPPGNNYDAGYFGIHFFDDSTERLWAGKTFGNKLLGLDSGGYTGGSFEFYNGTYLLVIKYDFDSGTAGAYIRNSGETMPTNEPSFTLTRSNPGVPRINRIRVSAQDVGTFCFDEVRVARTWQNLLNFFENEPTVQASSMTFDNVTTGSMTVGWTPGSGAGRIVVAREGAAVSWTPTDGQTYTANSDYSAGTDLGSGNKVIYDESGASVDVTGLDPATRYYFKVFEYNASSGSPDYLTTGSVLEGNRWTLTAEPAGVPSGFLTYALSDTALSNTWEAASGSPAASGYVVYRRPDQAVTNVPQDGVAYTDGQTIDDVTVRVISSGTASTVLHSALSSCSIYHFRIFAFNQSGAEGQTINYNTSSGPASSGDTQCEQPSAQASNIVFSSVGTNTITLTWENGSGEGRVVVVRGTNAVNQFPGDGTTYTADPGYGSGSHLGAGNYVVYNGTGTSVSVTGLVTATVYHFHVMEYNGSGSGIDYNTGTANDNPRSTATAAFGLVYEGFQYGNWENLSGKTGGTGWTNAWATGGGLFESSASSFPNFGAYPADDGSTVAGYADLGNASEDGSGKRSATRYFPAMTSGRMYMGIKIWTDHTMGASDYFGVNFMNGGNTTGFFGKAFGVADQRLAVDHNGTSRTNKLDGSNSGYQINAGTDYLLIAMYDFDLKQFKVKGYIQTQLAHTDAEFENAWDVEMDNVYIDRIDGIQVIASDNNQEISFDSIRISPSWEQTVWGLPDNWHENFGPTPSLVYIGTNYGPSFHSQVVTNLSDAELKSAGKIDFAVRWDAPSGWGIFITNNNASITNIGSPNGRVNPNWDPLAIGAATNPFNLDRFFDNFYGDNLDQVITTYQFSAFNITNINFENQYFVTVSAESWQNGASTVSAPNSGDAVPVSRAVTINTPLRFYVYDDDTNVPVRATSVGSAMMLMTNGALVSRQFLSENQIHRYLPTDGALAAVGMDLSFGVWDTYSGLQRASSGSADTNMHIAITALTTNNIADYQAAKSSSVTTNIGTTSVWTFANTVFDYATLSDMWGGDGSSLVGQDLNVFATVPDADDDRVADQTVLSNELFGIIRLLDDDPDPPSVGTTPLQISLGDSVIPAAQNGTLIAGWNFNANNMTVSHGAGTLTTNFSGGVSHSTGTDINAYNGDAAGSDFTVTGSGQNGRYLQFQLDMTGEINLVMTFAAQRSATGFDEIQVSYSTDGSFFTDYGSPIDPGETWATRTVDFSAVDSLNGAATVYIRLTVDGSTGGNVRFDNIRFNTGFFYEITDGMLAAVESTNALHFTFNVYDPHSGLARGADPGTNTHVNIDGLATNNAAYNASRSTAGTTVSSSTSTWSFTSFSYGGIGDLYGDGTINRPIQASLADVDSDRLNDAAWASNRFFGQFRVIDDDTNTPAVVNIDYAGASSRPWFMLTNGAALAGDLIRGTYNRRQGTGSNTLFAITDGEAAQLGTRNVQFAFGARDTHSGVSRGTSGSTNEVMNFSIGNILVGEIAGYDAASSTANSGTNVVQTNVWSFSDGDFTETVITQLMAATTASEGTRVTVTIPDADDDRPDDRLALVSQQVGYLQVFDDDIRGPVMSVVTMPNIPSDDTILATSFETSEGWNNQSSGSLWSQVVTSGFGTGTWYGTGYRNLGDAYSGTYKGGFTVTGVGQYIQLPARENPGTLSVAARLSSGTAADRYVQAEYWDTVGSEWVSAGSNEVTTADYDLLTWNISVSGLTTLRVVRVGADGTPGIFIDNIRLIEDIALAEPDTEGWTTNSSINITWEAAVDDYSNVGEYRVVAPAVGSEAPDAADDGVQVSNAATNSIQSLAGQQGIITGFVFAVDDDSDRTDDEAVGNIVPIVVRIDTNPPPPAVGLRATDADNDLFDLTIDESSEIKVEWTPAGATADEGAGWRQSDSQPLSPWDSYVVTYYEVANTNGDAQANALTTTISRADAAYSNTLNSWSFTNLVLSDLEFDAYYQIEIQGRDKAGNIGLATSVIGYTARFIVTQGVARTGTDLFVRWTGPTNELVFRDYDVLVLDNSTGFRNSTSNQWSLLTYTNRPTLIDTGAVGRVAPGYLTNNTYRFYRVAKQDRWKTNNEIRVASEEIYVTKSFDLKVGENWHSLFFVPDTGTVQYVFGTNLLPRSDNSSFSTVISWYDESRSVTCQIFLAEDQTWQYLVGGSGQVPEHWEFPVTQGFNIEVPDATNLIVIGRLPIAPMTNMIIAPTDAGAAMTDTGAAYNVVSFALPVRTAISNLGFQDSGLAKANFPPPFGSPDEIRILSNASGNGSINSPKARLFMKNDNNFYHWASPNTLANSYVVEPDDAVIIVRRNVGDFAWTNNITPFYDPPTKNMSP